jgi:hypothetical protein
LQQKTSIAIVKVVHVHDFNVSASSGDNHSLPTTPTGILKKSNPLPAVYKSSKFVAKLDH